MEEHGPPPRHGEGGREGMKRTDKQWKSWGFSRYSPNGWWVFRTPAGSFGIDHHRSVTEQGISRGRRKEWELRIPLTKSWQVHLSTQGKDYLTLVGGPKYLRNINWILDEFDYSFNDLAIASLKYHLDWSVCDNSNRRQEYEDIIARLNEPQPKMFDPGEEHLRGQLHALSFDKAVNETPDEIAKIFDRWHARERAWMDRVDEARHDFVDVIRELWS